MDKASKLLEDMIVSQPQLPVAYRKLSLNPPIVDGMITLVPSPVNQIMSSMSHQLNQLTKWLVIPSLVNPQSPLRE